MRLMRRSSVLVIMATVGLVSSCSSSGSAVGAVDAAEEDRTFCQQAEALQTFQNDVAVDLADPAKAPAFLEVATDQLRVLADKAPADIEPEIEAVIAGYEALDAELAANDYQLDTLLFSDYSDPEASAATDRLDAFLATECGLLPGRADIDAPQPFTAAELDALVHPGGSTGTPDPSIDDATLTQLLTTELGLTNEQAACLIEGLGDDAAAILLGDPLVGGALADFEALLADCSIKPEDFG